MKGVGMNSSSQNDGPSRLPEELHGERTDADISGNPLWSRYEREVKGCDKARIQDLKDDMKGVLIFVRLYCLSINDQPWLMVSHLRLVYFPMSSLPSSFPRFRI